jgi:hypothetical protein
LIEEKEETEKRANKFEDLSNKLQESLKVFG